MNPYLSFENICQHHEVKVENSLFEPIDRGDKKQLILCSRIRDFEAGQIIKITETLHPVHDQPTGRSIRVLCTHVLHKHPGLQDGYSILSILRIS